MCPAPTCRAQGDRAHLARIPKKNVFKISWSNRRVTVEDTCTHTGLTHGTVMRIIKKRHANDKSEWSLGAKKTRRQQEINSTDLL